MPALPEASSFSSKGGSIGEGKGQLTDSPGQRGLGWGLAAAELLWLLSAGVCMRAGAALRDSSPSRRAARARSWVTGFAAPSPRLIGFASSLLNVYNRDRGRGRGCSVRRSGTRASACGPHAHIEKPRSSHGEAGADGEPAGLAAWGLRVCSPIAGAVFTEDGARGRGGRSRSGSCTAVGPALPARRVFAWDRVSGTRVDLKDSGREAALRSGSGAAIAAHRVTRR